VTIPLKLRGGNLETQWKMLRPVTCQQLYVHHHNGTRRAAQQTGTKMPDGINGRYGDLGPSSACCMLRTPKAFAPRWRFFDLLDDVFAANSSSGSARRRRLCSQRGNKKQAVTPLGFRRCLQKFFPGEKKKAQNPAERT